VTADLLEYIAIGLLSIYATGAAFNKKLPLPSWLESWRKWYKLLGPIALLGAIAGIASVALGIK
jgi:hypothetical protein